MYGAIPYLMQAFGLDRDTAFRIVCDWVDQQQAERRRGRRTRPRPGNPAGLRVCAGGRTSRHLARPQAPQRVSPLARPSHLTGRRFPVPSRGHMKASIVAGSLLSGLTLTRAAAGAAGRGRRGAAQRSGRGHVVWVDGYSTYRRPVVYRAPARVIVVERVVPRVVVVERLAHRHRGFARSWRRHGYRPVVVYYVDGRYYDRYVRGWPEMREVVVYERTGGRYHEWDDDRDRRHDRDRALRSTLGRLTCPRAFRRLISPIQVGCRSSDPRPRRG